MDKRRFYYNKSMVYGWCVYDRQTHTPAFEGCAELLPPVRSDESGTVAVDPCCDNEYEAMRLCCKLNLRDRVSNK